MKIDAQMDPKSHPKIDIWAIRALTFEVSGGFGRSLIFDEFSDGGKLLKIDKVGDMGRPRGECAQIWGRVGGQGGGHRRLLESDRNWLESDNAFSTPCTPKGGGGFKGLRPTRRP